MMIDTKPKSRAMILVKAKRLAGASVSKDWPDALTTEEIANLQYPDDDDARRDFQVLLDAKIEHGAYETVTVQRDALIQALGDPWKYWQVKALAKSVVVRALVELEIEPSPYVLAWLADMWQAVEAAGNEKAGAGGTAEADQGQPPNSESPEERRAIAAKSARGVRREILEHWDGIAKLHGDSPDVAQVARYLTRQRGDSESKPKHKGVSNRLAELRREGLIP